MNPSHACRDRSFGRGTVKGRIGRQWLWSVCGELAGEHAISRNKSDITLRIALRSSSPQQDAFMALLPNFKFLIFQVHQLKHLLFRISGLLVSFAHALRLISIYS
jgi:hypothetical protein